MLTLWYSDAWPMSAGSRGGEVLLLYIMGYGVLVIALAFALLAAGGRRSAGDNGGAVFVQLSQARLRWLMIALVLGMAGLPPFFFFGCKLGLLGLLLRAGSWYHLALVSGLLLLSWSAYYAIVVKLLIPLIAAPTAPLRQARLSGRAALVGALCFILCLTGFLLLDDAYLLAKWACQ